MKLAEALIERAELQKKNAQLFNRITSNVMVQEGGIAERDNLKSKISVYRSIYEAATIKQERYNANEIKFVRCIDAKALQYTINQLSKEYREIDTKLQGLNWTVDFIES